MRSTLGAKFGKVKRFLPQIWHFLCKDRYFRTMNGTHEELMRALGQEIQSWRKRRRLTRDHLAELAGISTTTMGRIEREGPVDVEVTWRIADALQVGFADLVRRAEEAVTLSESRDDATAGYLPGEQLPLLEPQPGEQLRLGEAASEFKIPDRAAARRGTSKLKQQQARLGQIGEESQDPDDL